MENSSDAKLHVVFVHHGGHHGGGFLSLLYLLELLVAHIQITLVNSTGNKCVREYVEKLGIRVIDFDLMRAPHSAVGIFRITNPIHLYSYYIWRRKFASTCEGFRELLVSLNPDIVHLNSLTFLHYASVPKSMGIPTVLHIREHSSKGFLGITKMITKYSINRNVDYTIFICKDYLLEYSDFTIPYSVIYNPVPASKFFPSTEGAKYRKELGIPDEALVAFFPGGTDLEIKGIEDFIDALNHYNGVKKLYAIIPGFEMTDNASLQEARKSMFSKGIKNVPSSICGILRMRRRLDLSNKIREFGSHCNYIFPEFSFEVEKYYWASDIVVILHKIPHYSRSVLEAGAMRIPVVAYRTSGVTELLFDGLNAMTTELNHVKEITRSLEILSSNRRLLANLGDGGVILNDAINFSSTKDRMLKIYNTLV